METQDDLFCHLASRSAPTGLAIVHWIGCIKAIKCYVSFHIQNMEWLRYSKALHAVPAMSMLDTGIQDTVT